ncbi:MAG: iron-sulfur cluster assembly protein [Candidatus Dojkabacteria bacterium]|nr:iron-sulfur cluster assembly protein [Candidatus Dojkabacteria bacterium]
MNKKEKIIEILKSVHDPEIPINIYDLGLIYNLSIEDDKIDILMTLTSPNCPSAQEIPEEIVTKLNSEFPEMKININMTWNPPWDKSRMSEEARLALDMFDLEIPYHPPYIYDNDFMFIDIQDIDENEIGQNFEENVFNFESDKSDE